MDNGTAPLARFARTVRSDGWTNLFPALEELCQACIGHKLFSVSEFRLTGPESGVAARIYTSDSRNYPLSGLKEIVPNRWTGRVIREREVFVANSVEGFSDVFPDHEMIAALGLGSVINLPVVLGGEFIGTVNLLHAPGHYIDDRLAKLDQLALPAVLSFAIDRDAKP